MIIIKNDKEIEKMREAGKRLAFVHEEVAAYLKPGISTYDIDMYALKKVKSTGGTPSFYMLYDFPGNFCISLNDEVIHGIPSRDRILKSGDVLKIDGGVCYDGWQSDAARTYIIGVGSEEDRLLVERTRESFFKALEVCDINHHVNDIGKAIEDYIINFDYGIVDDYTGHGIGMNVHEDPEVPNFTCTTRGAKLRHNMTLAIEPMITLGTHKIKVDKDGWTVRTQDGKNSAHYENTVLITENGPEILTL